MTRYSLLILWLIFTLWSLTITYPLPFHLTSHIPLGQEPVATVPLFNLWTLQWNIQQLYHLPQSGGYWDAPIFAPEHGTFAFSEPQPLTAWLALPLWGLSPVLAYNTVLLFFLTLNSWFTYWLLRSWQISPPASFGTGLLMPVLPALTQELGVIQLTALFGFLWTLRFLKPTTLKQSFALALGLTVTCLTCGYYGLFSLLFLPLAGLSLMTWSRPVCGAPQSKLCASFLRYLIFALFMATLLTAPFIWTQQQQLARHGFQRSTKTIEQNSARLADYARVLDNNIFYGQMLSLHLGTGQRLFPGFGLIFLTILGTLAPGHDRKKIYLLMAIGLAWLLSFGLRLHIGGYQPYQFLRDYLPGFAQLRSPFRFAIFMQLHLALLAGLGLDFIRRNMGLSLFTLGLTLTIAEALALPLPLHPMPPPPPIAAWQTWLHQQPHPLTIVMLPFAADNGAGTFEPTVEWMLAQPTFQANLVNGYSGFFPPDHAALRDEMILFPTPKGLAMLRAKGVHYVVIAYGLPLAPRHVPLPRVFWDDAAQVGIYSLTTRN